MGKAQSQLSSRPLVFAASSAYMVSGERGAPLGSQLWAAAIISTKPAEGMGPVIPLLCFYGEPGCWMHAGLLPGQKLDAEGLPEELNSYRAEVPSC